MLRTGELSVYRLVWGVIKVYTLSSPNWDAFTGAFWSNQRRRRIRTMFESSQLRTSLKFYEVRKFLLGTLLDHFGTDCFLVASVLFLDGSKSCLLDRVDFAVDSDLT